MGKKTKCFVIDRLLSEGWFKSEKEALPWVMSRKILVNNQPISSLKEKINIDTEIRIKEYYKTKYVNKGGLKLEKPLNTFQIDVVDKIALDCGASTGGFTDCLIQKGAKLVYAVDVGFGQLSSKLLLDEKVINMERTNLSDVPLKKLNPTPEIISLDLSYLSLKKAIPICLDIMPEKGIVICLVKPLFEIDESEARRSGQINNPLYFKSILKELCDYFRNLKLNILGITASPITGNNGTIEYFIGLHWGNDKLSNINSNYQYYIDAAVEESSKLDSFDKNSYHFDNLK